MTHIIALNVERTSGDTNGYYTAKVSWAYGDETPDILQIHATTGTGVNEQTVVFSVTENVAQTTEGSLKLALGLLWTIFVCPRSKGLDDEGHTVALEKTKVNGTEEYWETQCLFQSIIYQGEPGGPSAKPYKPTITDVTFDEGSFTVWWTNGDYHRDVVTIEQDTSISPLDRQEFKSNVRRYTFDNTVGGSTYKVSVQSRTADNVFSDPDVRMVTVPEELGFQQWRNWESLGENKFDHLSQKLAVVSKGTIDLFVIGFDNQVWTKHYHERFGWMLPWLPIPAPRAFDYKTHRITALARNLNTIDLFIVADDGKVWNIAGTGRLLLSWGPWRQMMLGEFEFPRARISGAGRGKDFDLFAPSKDGYLMQASWYPYIGWGPWKRAPSQPPEPIVINPLSVWTLDEDHIDLATIGKDNKVWTVHWSRGGGWSSWSQIGGTIDFDGNCQIPALASSGDGEMHAYAILPDARAVTASRPPNGIWTEWSLWPFRPRIKVDPRTQQLWPVINAENVRGNRTIEVFAISTDGQVVQTDIADWKHTRASWTFDPEHQHVVALQSRFKMMNLFIIGSDDIVRTSFWTRWKHNVV